MAKATSKEIIARVRSKEEKELKANVTFRLNKSLMDKFRSKCETQKVSMASILEELIADFVA